MTGSEGFNVDICVTCLTDKPPKLPLREELMSLGVEVIYNARGVGSKVSQHEAHKAVKEFRERETTKELKKRRFFRKSSSRIKEQLAERKRIEHDLKRLHAFSYEVYENELQRDSYDNDDDGNSGRSSSPSSGGSSSSGKDTDATSMSSGTPKSRKKVGSARRYWGLRRKNSDAKSKASDPKSKMDGPGNNEKFYQGGKPHTLEDLVGKDVFQDFLAPMVQEAKNAKAPPSYSPSVASHDPSSISTKIQDPDGHEVQFIASSTAEHYLPGLKTVAEAERDAKPPPGHIDVPVKKAFQKYEAKNPIYNANSDDSSESSVYVEDKEAGPAVGNKALVSPANGAFDNVAAEVYGASATEMETPGTDTALATPTSTNKDPPVSPEVLQAAKQAFENVSDDIYQAGGMDNETDGLSLKASQSSMILSQGSGLRPPLCPKVAVKRDSPSVTTTRSGTSSDGVSVDTFFAILEKADTAKEIEEILNASPELCYVRNQATGRTPLHTLCDRGIRVRSSEPVQCLVDDISTCEDLVQRVVDSHPDACMIVDRKGDLAAHLLARRLMEWEAGWYETIYEQAQSEQDPQGRTALVITTLYQIMSRCIHMLLKPLVGCEDLCREPGSIGCILPLHIAAIFTASVPTLRGILEGYPDAATLRCDLGNLCTFIPDKALPLELHDNLSTDFPKWEVEATHDAHPEIRWSQSRISKKKLDDCMRRSDLLFAYNPFVAPYRFEKSRIRRLESRIQFEAKQIVESDDITCLNRATEQVWIWMCSFQEEKSKRPTYINSVKRVLDPLPLKLVKLLASIDTGGGTPVIDSANPECSLAMQKRMDCVTKMIVPVGGSYTTVSTMTDKSASQTSLLKTWEDTQSARLSLKGKGYAGFLCRTIFNVKENSFPTSFIILPYRLTKGKNGKLGMDSADSVTVAMKFAECLLQLTEARSVLYYLDSKAKRHYDESLYATTDEKTSRDSQYAKIEEYQNALLEHYAQGKAYMYLIDEATGVPMVPSGSSSYPLELSDPVSMVKKLLPLMLVGMILMRGDKAISVLSSVLLDDSVSVVPPGWIDAAKEINAYLQSRESKEPEKAPQVSAQRSNLVRFVTQSSSKRKLSPKSKSNVSEWNAELSILKALLDENDNELLFGGLEAQYEGDEAILWAKSTTLSIDDKSVSESIQKSHSEGGFTTDYSSSVSVQDNSSLISQSINEDNLNSACSDSRRMDFYQQQENDTGDESESEDSDAENKLPQDSKYFLLFRDLAHSKQLLHDEEMEERDCRETVRSIGHESDRVYEEVSYKLNRGTEYWQDWELLQLKVELADQARRLSFLNKKVTTIKETEVVVFENKEKLYTLLNEASVRADDAHEVGLGRLRKLASRLCELEDRILCDEIDMQHLELGVFSLDGQIDRFIEQEDREARFDSLRDALSETEGSEREGPPTSSSILPRRSSARRSKRQREKAKKASSLTGATVDWIKYSAETGRIEL